MKKACALRPQRSLHLPREKAHLRSRDSSMPYLTPSKKKKKQRLLLRWTVRAALGVPTWTPPLCILRHGPLLWEPSGAVRRLYYDWASFS